MNTEAHPVVIAGAGPAGLVAAVTLARQGVGSLLVERRGALSQFPRATGVGVRTMELLRSWGLEDQARAGQTDVVDAHGWLTPALASPDGVAIPEGFPLRAQVAGHSPTTFAVIPQDHLEPVLLAHLRTFSTSHVRFGTEVVGFDQDDDGITVHLRGPDGTPTAVRCRVLVGADGAHSAVRAAMGVRMEGPDRLANVVTVLFEAPLDAVVGDRRYPIYLIEHPDAGGVLVPSGGYTRWIYGHYWDPQRERLEDYPPERLADMIRTATGVPDLDLRIVRTGAFTFAAQVAERYRSGRVFLAGDAAHRMTPRGGRGMNTAIHDGHDLGWKVAWVLRGWADTPLLDTYETERRPVGLRNTALSAQQGPVIGGMRALADDLAGRLPHAWLDGTARRSTLDLIGPGLTLLTGPAGERWRAVRADTVVPLHTYALDDAASAAVGSNRDGAVLVRPDGHVVTRWPVVPADPAGEVRTALRRLSVERGHHHSGESAHRIRSPRSPGCVAHGRVSSLRRQAADRRPDAARRGTPADARTPRGR
jgi:putative polyketide hydroxylase